MVQLFKEFPFTIAGGLVAAGGAAWLGQPWWVILLAFVGGLFVGAIIDESGKSRRGVS